jgi:hypothetical protein
MRNPFRYFDGSITALEIVSARGLRFQLATLPLWPRRMTGLDALRQVQTRIPKKPATITKTTTTPMM